jgi:hypothetical protein
MDLLDSKANSAEKDAETAVKSQQYVKAIDLYDRAIELRQEIVSLAGTDASSADLLIDVYGPAVQSAIAEKAYAQWLNQESDLALGTLATATPKVTTQGLDTRARFAFLVNDEASRLFGAQKWENSAAAYRFAREQYLLAMKGQYDKVAGELQYNEAVAYSNAGRTAEARKLLSDLKQRLPQYEPKDVAEVAAHINSREQLAVFDSIVNEASKAFNKKDWSVAAARFKDAAEYLLKAGYPADSERVATSRYNIAMAYFNARRYNESYEVLHELQATAPRYNPSVVREQLASADRMRKLFDQGN